MYRLEDTPILSGSTIGYVETMILDLPIRRPHEFAHQTMNRQSHVLVRIRSEDGLEGIGEGVTAGGPWWGGESVETIKAMVDTYLTPVLIGENPSRINYLLEQMERVASGNACAKTAVEMALYDLVGKRLGIPVYELLGGLYRDSLPVLWAVGAGDTSDAIAEMETKLAEGSHRRFKVKVGRGEPWADARRIKEISMALGENADLVIDPNCFWDVPTAMRMIPKLAECSVSLLEQPIPRWDVTGMAKLSDMQLIPIMGDEGVCSSQDALKFAEKRAAHVFSLKLHKAGGIARSASMASVASAAGVRLFGGTTLETSIGTAASLHLFCSLPELSEGCELFGPKLLAEDIVENPIEYRDFQVWIPKLPGLGITLDEEKVDRYRRSS